MSRSGFELWQYASGRHDPRLGARASPPLCFQLERDLSLQLRNHLSRNADRRIPQEGLHTMVPEGTRGIQHMREALAKFRWEKHD
jgi:hypothetical protein